MPPINQITELAFWLEDDESLTIRRQSGRVPGQMPGDRLKIVIRKHATDGGRDYAVESFLDRRTAEDSNVDLLAYLIRKSLVQLREDKPREPFKETT